MSVQPGHPHAPAGPLARLTERMRGLDESADRAVLARAHSRVLMLTGFLETQLSSLSDRNAVEVREIIEYLK